MKRIVLTALLIIAANDIHAISWEENAKVGKLFTGAGVQGTFVLYDTEAGSFTGHNRRRAQQRYLPASTFKIPNTLIGLAVGAVKDVDQVLPYGGKPQPIKEWEQDMSLRQAIRISNVPVYQELARRIGPDRMRRSVAKLAFGNGLIGTTVDNFWLIGPLKISAVEQAEFLCRLALNQLPFPKDSQAKTREIALLETGPSWNLYGKTGWAKDNEPEVGWWVGWVQKGDRPYCFALNIDMPRGADAGKRVSLGRASLKELGLP